MYSLYCTRGEEETRFFREAAATYRHFEVVETGWPKIDPLFLENDTRDIRKEIGTDKPIVFLRRLSVLP